MKPLNIVQFLPGKIWGGAEQYILDFSIQLISQGHNVTFVGCDAEPVRRVLDTYKQFETVYVPVGIFKRHRVARIISQVISDANVLNIHDVSWLHTAVKAKKIAGNDTRIVLTRHIARSSRTMPWRRDDFKYLHRMIFVSSFARDMWMKVNDWMAEDKITVVNNSIPPLQAKSIKTLRQEYGVAYDTPLLVYSGRVRRTKGCETIMRALSRIKDKDFCMVFIGACKPDNYHEHLRSMASKAGIAHKVHFYGFSSDVRHLISDADIGLAPSIVRESFHLSPIEFMQQGKCVITSDNGAQSGYIKDGETGILLHPDDDVALAEKITELIDDKLLRERIGKKAKQYFENYFSYSAFINKMIDIYCE